MPYGKKKGPKIILRRSAGLRRGPMVGCCEHGDENLDSIKGRDFLDQLSDYHLLRKTCFAVRGVADLIRYDSSYDLPTMKFEIQYTVT
jgi:hypothetical protein